MKRIWSRLHNDPPDETQAAKQLQETYNYRLPVARPLDHVNFVEEKRGGVQIRLLQNGRSCYWWRSS